MIASVQHARSRLAASCRKLAAHLAAGLFALAATLTAAGPAWAAGGVIRDAEIEQTLRVYGDPIFEAAGLDTNDIDIYVIQDPSLNAFVAGGQNIFFHTGLILAADNPNELIGVLAHETGHIAGGHLVRSREAMGQSLGPALISIGLGVLLIAAGAGDAGGALIASAGTFAQGNFVRHTQAQESSADQAAVTYLDRAGQSSQGLLTFFNRNLRPYEFQVRRAPPYVLSHPFVSDRVESLRPRIDAATHRNAPDSEDYVRRFEFMQAKLYGFLNNQGQTLAQYPQSDTSQPARYARAIAYYRTADMPNAMHELDALLAEAPDNPYFNELKGQVLFENARAAESIAYHRRSVELAPNEPLLQINLARALMQANGREGAEEAVPLLQAALGREPHNSFAWGELANAREALGERGLAELASAEQNYARGDFALALNFAERARRTLTRGTVAYQRADDITNFASTHMQEQAGRGGR